MPRKPYAAISAMASTSSDRAPVTCDSMNGVIGKKANPIALVAIEDTRKVVVQASGAVDVSRSRNTTNPENRAMMLRVVWSHVRLRMMGSQVSTSWSMTDP